MASPSGKSNTLYRAWTRMPIILEERLGSFHDEQIPAVPVHRIIEVINAGTGRDHGQNVPKPVLELIHRMSELYGFHHIRLLFHLAILE